MCTRMSQMNRARASITATVLIAAACSAVYAAQPLEAGGLAVGGRQLQTVLAQKVADNAQDRWLNAGSALLATIASVFTKANIELAKAAFEEVAGALLAEGTPAPAAAVAAASAQPVAQVVYLPEQDNGGGIRLHTSTPVNVGAPVNVDTPVQQDSVQVAGLPSLLGHRRLA